MNALLAQPDPDGLLEFSVVYTDRALNHMSRRFQQVMRDISRILKHVYVADTVAVIPGSGTFGMEAVARQFANGKRCLIIRNGWFSFRWSQILEMSGLAKEIHVLKAGRTAAGARGADLEVTEPFAPPPLQQVLDAIADFKPHVIFAPHVETSSGIILPDEYVRAIGQALRAHDGLFVLDCIASGAVWVDMTDKNVDVLISAPQKGWSGPACGALVALGERATRALDTTASTSFSCDLKKWVQIMAAYEGGGHAYHTTLPTDALAGVRDVMIETERYGFEKLSREQWHLGRSVRALLADRGFKSVAATGFQSPGVVVSFTSDPALQSGKRFMDAGLQIAAGVPLQCDEGPDYRSFRLGLFGLDKLHQPDRTTRALERALDTLR